MGGGGTIPVHSISLPHPLSSTHPPFRPTGSSLPALERGHSFQLLLQLQASSPLVMPVSFTPGCPFLPISILLRRRPHLWEPFLAAGDCLPHLSSRRFSPSCPQQVWPQCVVTFHGHSSITERKTPPSYTLSTAEAYKEGSLLPPTCPL